MDRARFSVIACIIAVVAFATWPAASFAGAPLASVAGARAVSESGVRHFDLRTSAPMADSTVNSAAEVRLWFTQPPQDGTTQIRVRREGALLEVTDVAMGDAQPEAGDPMVYFASAERPLTPGHYQVRWRSMAADGHVVDGEYPFGVADEGVPN